MKYLPVSVRNAERSLERFPHLLVRIRTYRNTMRWQDYESAKRILELLNLDHSLDREIADYVNV